MKKRKIKKQEKIIKKIKSSKKIKIISQKEKKEIKIIKGNVKLNPSPLDLDNMEFSERNINSDSSSPVLNQIAIQRNPNELEQDVASSQIKGLSQEDEQIKYSESSNNSNADGKYISNLDANARRRGDQNVNYNPNSETQTVDTINEPNLIQRGNQRINEGLVEQTTESSFDALGENRRSRERNENLAGIQGIASGTSEYKTQESEKKYNP